MNSASAVTRILGAAIVAAGIALGAPVGADAAIAANLNNVIVYPSPFDVRLNHTVVTFANLTSTATLRIYKLTGEVVFEKEFTTVDGNAVWDVTNKDNNKVASGLYIYLITNSDGQKKTGKIAILR